MTVRGAAAGSLFIYCQQHIKEERAKKKIERVVHKTQNERGEEEALASSSLYGEGGSQIEDIYGLSHSIVTTAIAQSPNSINNKHKKKKELFPSGEKRRENIFLCARGCN